MRAGTHTRLFIGTRGVLPHRAKISQAFNRRPIRLSELLARSTNIHKACSPFLSHNRIEPTRSWALPLLSTKVRESNISAEFQFYLDTLRPRHLQETNVDLPGRW